MFKQILAIDVHNKIPNFSLMAKQYSYLEPVIKDNSLLIDDSEISNIDAIWLSFNVSLEKNLLLKLKNLKYIFVYGSSSKKIDLEYCNLNNIKVHTVTDYCDNETAEWVIGQIIQFFRHKLLSINGKVLGLIGVGAVGKVVLKIALALKMEVFYYALTIHKDLLEIGAKEKSIKDIFKNSDIVSLHSPAFLKCIFYEHLSSAKKNLLLINTCLGPVIDENDLLKFLSERNDIDIIMDKVAASFYGHPRILFVQQKAYVTNESLDRLNKKFFANINNANPNN